jgi:hypothetical protein
MLQTYPHMSDHNAGERIVEELAVIGFASLNHRVKVADKRQALLDLGKHLPGMLIEEQQHKHAGIVARFDAVDMAT